MNDRIIRSLVLGISAMVGFTVTEAMYSIGVKLAQKEQEKNIIEMVEAPEELESE